MMDQQEHRRGDLDAAVARGIDDANAGRTKPAAEVFDRLQAKYAAMLFAEDEATN